MFAGDHFVIRLPRTHHGIDAGIGIDHDLEEGRTAETNELVDDARYIGFLVEPRGVLKAVCQRRLDEILGVQALVAGAEAALEE